MHVTVSAAKVGLTIFGAYPDGSFCCNYAGGIFCSEYIHCHYALDCFYCNHEASLSFIDIM